MKNRELIGDKYRVLEVLGQGGTSVVYLAENLVLGNLWAIKALSKNSPWFNYEMQEISMLKLLSHPMLPRIADLIEDQDSCYIVMDYISGTNLLDYVQKKGRIDEKTLLSWSRDLLEVLSYLHGRNPPVIYRDLKPSNLIMDDTGRIKLVDFGTAQLHEDGKFEDTVYIGTQGYAAPEQFGLGRSDARTDIYNLGMTLVHLATGIHPLKLDTAHVQSALKQAGISARFLHFLLRLIQTDPSRRPQCCSDALKELERITLPKSLFAGRNSTKGFQGGFKSVIAISSVLPGSGVTSFCLMLGSFFSRQGLQTALAELNTSRDFERLRIMLEQAGELKKKSEASFETEYMTFYDAITDSSQIPRKNHDVIILDLGALSSERGVQELNHADIRLILCPNVPWKYPHLLEFQERYRYLTKDAWIYAVCTPHKYEEQYIKKQYKLDPLLSFSYPLNPFSFSTDDEKRIGRTVKQIYYLAGQKVTF